MKKFCLLLLIFFSSVPLTMRGQKKPLQPTGENNLAYKWGEIAMTCTANDTEKFKPRPTVTSRYLGLIWTAVFDSWSRFDDKAIPLYLKNVKRSRQNFFTASMIMYVEEIYRCF